MISASAAGARSGYSGPARPADPAPRETRSRRTDLAAKALFRSSWLFSQSARLRTPHARESFPRNRATAFSFTQAVSLALDAATGCKRKQRRCASGHSGGTAGGRRKSGDRRGSGVSSLQSEAHYASYPPLLSILLLLSSAPGNGVPGPASEPRGSIVRSTNRSILGA